MKKQILLLCLALTSLCSYAQTITVKGVVTSASDKEPMIGATVQVKGTGTGTITSIDGDYSLNDVAKDAVLVFSSIGYETQEIKVNGQTVINVVLKDASELLDEVVVIGYVAVNRRLNFVSFFINTVTVASGAAENTGAAKSPSIVINTS